MVRVTRGAELVALSLELAAEHAIYADDAYLLTFALQQRALLLTLDVALARTASQIGIDRMKEFTYSEARKQLAARLDRARRDGAVRIRRRDGQVFVLRPERASGSPLDVPGLNVPVTREELVELVHEGRRPASHSRHRLVLSASPSDAPRCFTCLRHPQAVDNRGSIDDQSRA